MYQPSVAPLNAALFWSLAAFGKLGVCGVRGVGGVGVGEAAYEGTSRGCGGGAAVRRMEVAGGRGWGRDDSQLPASDRRFIKAVSPARGIYEEQRAHNIHTYVTGLRERATAFYPGAGQSKAPTLRPGSPAPIRRPYNLYNLENLTSI
jgi:hypothetical protein